LYLVAQYFWVRRNHSTIRETLHLSAFLHGKFSECDYYYYYYYFYYYYRFDIVVVAADTATLWLQA